MLERIESILADIVYYFPWLPTTLIVVGVFLVTFSLLYAFVNFYN